MVRRTTELGSGFGTPAHVTTRLSPYRLFVWVTANTLPDSRLVAFAREDDYFFGVLHSRTHEVWSRRTAGAQRREALSGFTYTPSTCFETFPFPDPTPEMRARVGEAARHLVELRDGWLNPPGLDSADLAKRTLTNLYNQRPTWLVNTHADLDDAVFAAYGWPADLSDTDILEGDMTDRRPTFVPDRTPATSMAIRSGSARWRSALREPLALSSHPSQIRSLARGAWARQLSLKRYAAGCQPHLS